jgi:hypothetical protein
MPGERDGFPLTTLPSLSEMGGLSPNVRRAGAALIEDFKSSLGSEELAVAVYIAMVRQQLRENTQEPQV